MKKIDTYKRLFILIVISSISFLLLFFSLFWFVDEHKKKVFSATQEKYQAEITALLMLNSKFLLSNLQDKTFWDDLVNFVNNNNKQWFNSLVVPTLELYNLEYIAIYNEKGNLVRDVNYNTSLKIPLNSELKRILDKKRIIKYYTNINNNIFEVFIATIHPTNDPYKKTNPRGYYLIARIIDSDFIKELEIISSSKIILSDTNSFKKYGENYIQDTTQLLDYNNKTINYLVFKRPFSVDYKIIIQILIFILIVITINTLLFIFFIRIWIRNPLQLITKILKSEDKEVVPDLKKSPGEFAYIGELIEESLIQKEELKKSRVKAEESDQLKTSFLTNLSHEIRTPMNAIIGFTNLIKNEKLDKKETENYLSIIESSGNTLISIIDDLIEMSKIDTQQVSPNFSTFNLYLTLQQLHNLIKITIPKDKNIELVYVPDIPININSDEVKLKQIISNLLTNAIKFTTSGKVEFGYKINTTTNKLEFYVNDTGIGIPQDELPKVFERFKRANNEFGISNTGLGLGLSICKAYIELLNGSIQIKSEVNKGTSITFQLPLLESSKIKETTFDSNINLSNTDISHLTILVAEDDHINFLLINKLLTNKGIKVVRAVNGLEAVNFAKNSKFDLILMDLKMPIMNGFEAFCKIREFNHSTPIVAQTAFTANDEIIKINEMGFNGYITKPIDKDKLYSTMQNNI